MASCLPTIGAAAHGDAKIGQPTNLMGKTGEKYKSRNAGYKSPERTAAYGDGKSAFWSRKESPAGKLHVPVGKSGRGGAPSGGIWMPVR